MDIPDKSLPSVIPFRMAVSESLPIQLLDARSRISAVSEPDEHSALRAAIEIEAWYRTADGSVGCRRETLAAILRGSGFPPSPRPRIVAEQYLLCPAGTPSGLPCLQGELHLGWNASSFPEPSPSASVVLDLVCERRKCEIPVQAAIRFGRPVRSVIDARISIDSAACWQGRFAAVSGTLRIEVMVEYDDGTLGRRTEAVPFEHLEAMDAPVGGSLHAFIEPSFVSPSLGGEGRSVDSVDTHVLLTAELVTAERRPVEVRQPKRSESRTASGLVIMSSGQRPIHRVTAQMTHRIALPGMPTGEIQTALKVADLQHLGNTVVQEVAAVCDVYFAAEGEERHTTAALDDVLLSTQFVSFERLSSRVTLQGPARLTAAEDGQWMLVVPLEWQLYEDDSQAVDVVESEPSPGSVEAVIREVVSRPPFRFLVPLPEEAAPDCHSMVDLRCIAGAGYCAIEGTLTVDRYTAPAEGPERMVSMEVPFAERIAVPSCLPGLATRCDCDIVIVPMERPVAMIEGRLTLTRLRPAWLARATAEKGGERADVSCHLFWRSEKPLRTCEDPLRIEARAEELLWRLAGDHLLIEGRLGRVIYFMGSEGRLYCSADRIPFKVLADVPGRPAEVSVKVARIESIISPKAGRKATALEEEYRLSLEVAALPDSEESAGG